MRGFIVKPVLWSCLIIWKQWVGRQRENTILMGLFTPFSEKKRLEHSKQESEKAAISRCWDVWVCVCLSHWDVPSAYY